MTEKTGCARKGAVGLQPIAGIPLTKSEIDTLRAENERLRAEVAYLGKLRALKSQERRAKVQAVDDLKAHYPLPLLLQIADLPRSTFYDHRRRLGRGDTRTDIKEAIRGAFEAANSAYGHRRILSVLLRQGWKVSKKTVLTLMRELGLACPVRRRKRYNSFRGEVGEAAENVLNRQFAAEAAHTTWATDVTEFNIGSSKVYLSPILDLHDNSDHVSDGRALSEREDGHRQPPYGHRHPQRWRKTTCPLRPRISVPPHPLEGNVARSRAHPVNVPQRHMPRLSVCFCRSKRVDSAKSQPERLDSCYE